MFKVLCLTLAITTAFSAALPTAIFHGMGDACANAGMKQITEKIGQLMGSHVECVDSAAGFTSLSMNFEEQATKACEMVKANKNFQNTRFNVMGLSQGGLIARYIAQSCDTDMPVNNVLTAGGPHMGVDDIPHCFDGIFCWFINSISKEMVYTKVVQDHFGPAGYFRDIAHYDDYMGASVFLAGESEKANAADKARFSQINGMMLVMFSEDTMIHPKETSQWGSLDAKGNLILMEDQDVYKSDIFGLKTINEAGKIKMVEVKGDHLQFTMEDVENTFVPFLINGPSYDESRIERLYKLFGY